MTYETEELRQLNKPVRVRHLHVKLSGASIADPKDEAHIMETDGYPSRGRESAIIWTGWRARLVRWVITVLLRLGPNPTWGVWRTK